MSLSQLSTLFGTQNAMQFLAVTQIGGDCWSTSQTRLAICGRDGAKNNSRPSLELHPLRVLPITHTTDDLTCIILTNNYSKTN
jgi:hypothetical protein